MRLRAIIFAVIAIAIALGTAQVARNWLSSQRAELEAQKKVEKPVTFILVAAKDLPTGSFIRPEDLSWQPWPEGQLLENYLRKGKDAEQTLVGSVVRSRIAAGEPITTGRVVKPGDRGFLAAVLSPGMRAVSVSVTATSGISGLVFPGDKVDLILSHTIHPEQRGQQQQQQQQRMASETVLTNIRVLAIDQSTDDQQGKPTLAKNVTFEVTPKQVEAIEVASDLGKLSLSLRSLGTDLDAAPSVPPITTVTWDSDVSKLLPPPPRIGGPSNKGEEEEGQKLTVLRGTGSDEVVTGTATHAAAAGTPGGPAPGAPRPATSNGKPAASAAGNAGG